jgi:thymidine phosphorylase
MSRSFKAVSNLGTLKSSGAWLKARRLGLYTQREPIVIMRSDCPVCRSEGLAARSQVLLRTDGREVTAVLFQYDDGDLRPDEIGLSEAAWKLLAGNEGELVQVTHVPPLNSMKWVRTRIFGQSLEQSAFDEIVGDVVAGRYSDVQLSAFITAGSAFPLTDDETLALTQSMANAGARLDWDRDIVVDKHCVGGLPGNRTTPIAVAIGAACGLTIPKTSSRAITSPAGTADAMETVTEIDIDLPTLRKVISQEGGCLAWGGALNLSPADDAFIGVERQLDVDPEGQLIASVLSKKIAAGATRLVLDIPVGPTAKVRSRAAGERLAMRMRDIAMRCGLEAVCIISDGSQPVGRSIGPALEMMDVLSVLRNESAAPADLRERAIRVAGAMLEVGEVASVGEGRGLAAQILEDGRAYRKFEAICRAQGRFSEPPLAHLQCTVTATSGGALTRIDNRKVAQVAKLAGAPDSPAAGLRLHARTGDSIEIGQPLMTVHADTEAELAYALDYASSNADMLRIEESTDKD